MKKVNLNSAYQSISTFWDPHIIGELNGQHVKIARIHGEFPMHQHEAEDELFLIHSGSLLMHFDNKPTIELNKGEMLVVPKGTLHAPEAKDPCEIILFEPASTLNTGDQENNFTKKNLNRLD